MLVCTNYLSSGDIRLGKERNSSMGDIKSGTYSYLILTLKSGSPINHRTSSESFQRPLEKVENYIFAMYNYKLYI